MRDKHSLAHPKTFARVSISLSDVSETIQVKPRRSSSVAKYGLISGSDFLGG